MFDTNDGEVVCRELGYAGGVFEVKPHSYYSEINTTVENPIVFLLDNLQCFGNESSLTECNFSEWGSHDCSPEEVGEISNYFYLILNSEYFKIDFFFFGNFFLREIDS